MGVRAFGIFLFLALGSLCLSAEDLGRSDRLRREYLSETVRRGLSLLPPAQVNAAVPHWSALGQAKIEALSLEPTPETALIAAWMDAWDGDREGAVFRLKAGWPHPSLSNFSQRRWGESLFRFWEPGDDSAAWTQAWLGWDEKSYSPVSLVRGIEVMERTDGSAVLPLLTQAVQLYPEDRRFLTLVAGHPQAVQQADALLNRDLRQRGGWGDAALSRLLRRSPSAAPLLGQVGYSPERLTVVLSRDYGTWLKSGSAQPPADGAWSWDADQDGTVESRLVFQGGTLVTWSRDADGAVWVLSCAAGRPTRVTETLGGQTWTLNYEAYPWVSTLEYRSGARLLRYRFSPLAQPVPLWPAERFQGTAERLPAALADLWLPIDTQALAAQAISLEVTESGISVQTLWLFHGEVWLSVEDSDRDGRDDTWSFYRSGVLASVYRDLEGKGQYDLREIYRQGELTQVQKNASGRTEFVFFPQDGVQLWDPHGNGRPLDRVFVSGGRSSLTALVFSGSSPPWETMPVWEPRP